MSVRRWVLFWCVISAFLALHPPTAVAQPTLPAVRLDSIAPGVWVHTSYGPYSGDIPVPSNGLVLRDEERLLLIDTAWGELATLSLLEVIEERLGLPITTAVVTHAHYDRIAGTRILQTRGVRVLSSPVTRRLAAHQGLPLPEALPDLGVVGASIRLGPVELYFPGPGHSPDNVVVWLADQRVLFGGCAVRSATATSPGNVEHADLTRWPHAIVDMTQRYRGVRLVIPGHGDPGGAELLEHTLALLSQLR